MLLNHHHNTFKAGFIVFSMIVVDIETSGLDFEKCGIWQIGAVDTDNIENTFLEECRIEKEYEFLLEGKWKGKKPEEVLGKTEEELRDIKKQSEKQLLENFFNWCNECRIKTWICQGPQFDHAILEHRSRKYNLIFPAGHRAMDLHSIAQAKYFELNGEFLIKEDKSDMGLGNILKLVGMLDNRKAHNALEDAKLTAECFSRIVYGKCLFPEYFEFKIPKYLMQEDEEC